MITGRPRFLGPGVDQFLNSDSFVFDQYILDTRTQRYMHLKMSLPPVQKARSSGIWITLGILPPN
jgi:hypothetical protein